MEHTFTITLSGEKAQGTFAQHYEMGLLYGAEYFDLCKCHAEDLLTIKVNRSLDIHKFGDSHVTIITVTLDDEILDLDEDDYEDDAEDDTIPSLLTPEDILDAFILSAFLSS